jgi:putative transposase
LPSIPNEHQQELYRYIGSVCQDQNCSVLAIGGTSNHIHLLIEFPNSVTLSNLLERVKGGSSRRMNALLRSDSSFKWQGGYSAISVSLYDALTVIRYIRNQKRHHAEGTLWPEAEKTSEEE